MCTKNSNLKIVKYLKAVHHFLCDANKLFNQNAAFYMAIEECIEALFQNTIYFTICSEYYDFNCREHDVNLKYIQGRCEGILNFSRHYRKMSDNQCVYFVFHNLENMLNEVINLINDVLPTEKPKSVGLVVGSDKKTNDILEPADVLEFLTQKVPLAPIIDDLKSVELPRETLTSRIARLWLEQLADATDLKSIKQEF